MINNHVSKGKNKKYQFIQKKTLANKNKNSWPRGKENQVQKNTIFDFCNPSQEDINFFNSSTLKNALMQSEVKNYHSTFCIIQNSY